MSTIATASLTTSTNSENPLSNPFLELCRKAQREDRAPFEASTMERARSTPLISFARLQNRNDSLSSITVGAVRLYEI